MADITSLNEFGGATEEKEKTPPVDFSKFGVPASSIGTNTSTSSVDFSKFGVPASSIGTNTSTATTVEEINQQKKAQSDNDPFKQALIQNIKALDLPLLFGFTGGAVGGVVTAPSGPLGMVAGSALLGEGGRRFGTLTEQVLTDIISNDGNISLLKDMYEQQGVPVKNLVNELVDSANRISIDMSLGSIGSAAPSAFKSAYVRGSNKVKDLLSDTKALTLAKDFREEFLNPTVGSIGGSVVKSIEQTLAQLPFSAKIIQGHINKTLDELSEVFNKKIQDAGELLTIEKSGGRLREVIKAKDKPSFLTHGYEKQDELYTAASKFVDQAQLHNSSNTQKMFEDILSVSDDMLDVLKESSEPIVFSIFKSMQKKKYKASATKINTFMKMVGSKVRENPESKLLNDLYGALKDDYASILLNSGNPKAIKMYQKAVDFSKEFHRKKEIISDIGDSLLSHEAFKSAISGASESPEKLRNLKGIVQEIDPKAWNDFVATYLHRISRATPVQQGGDVLPDFSVRSFIKNYNALRQSGSADILFDAPLKKSLDRLSKISDSLKFEEKIARSDTFFSNLFKGALSPQLVAGVTALSSTVFGVAPVAASAAAAGASLLSAKHFGKRMTSPEFIDWLAYGLKIPEQNVSMVGMHISKLPRILAQSNEYDAPDVVGAFDEILNAYSPDILSSVEKFAHANSPYAAQQ